MLAWEREVRIAALDSAVRRFHGVTVKSEQILETAEKFEAYIRGDEPDQIQIFSTPGEIWMDSSNPLPDLTGCEISVGRNDNRHLHTPIQNRDAKEPWCHTCGRNMYGQKPESLLRSE